MGYGDIKNEYGRLYPRKTEELHQSTRVDEANANTLYLGWADVGVIDNEAKWKIKKIYTEGNITYGKYADGDLNYDNVWTNRASLIYI